MWGKVPAHLEVLGPDYTDEKDSIWTMHMSLRLLDDSQVEVTRHLAHLRDIAKKYNHILFYIINIVLIYVICSEQQYYTSDRD